MQFVLSVVYTGQTQSVTQRLVDLGIVQESCRKQSNSNTEPYLEKSSYAPIARYLAASYTMRDLTTLNAYPNDTNYTAWCNTEFSSGLEAYCPERYCQQIKFLVDNKIEFVADAAGKWCDHNAIHPSYNYYRAIKQTITDINAAYDCAGLRRPIVQASIFECISYSPTYVSHIKIPKLVVELFRDELDFNPSQITGYNTDSVQLTFEQISSGRGNVPNINQIYGKIWLMHQAKIYIDAGYKALHLGQLVNLMNNSRDYKDVLKVVQTIKNYAVSKETFVLLNCENPIQDSRVSDAWPALHYRRNDSIFQIFDFDNIALRVQEATNPTTCGEYPLNSNYNNTPCQTNRYNGSINLCWMKARRTPSAYSSYGYLVQNTPVLAYFDSGHGIDRDNQTHEAAWTKYGVDAARYGEKGIYGWDDLSWFGNLETSCQEYFLKDILCRIGNIEQNMFILIPNNRVFTKTLNINEILLLTNRNTLNNSIQSIFFQPLSTYNFIATIGNSIFSYNSLRCNGQEAPYGYVWRVNLHAINLSVVNPDCRSIYSWHILENNNLWHQYSFGKTRAISTSSFAIKTYNVSLRIDNASIMPNGVYSITKILTTPQTCSLVRSSRLLLQKTAKNATPMRPMCFPIPTQSTLNISGLNNNFIEKIEIYNQLGIKISEHYYNETLEDIQLTETEVLSTGSYIIKIISFDNFCTLKFIKTNL